MSRAPRIAPLILAIGLAVGPLLAGCGADAGSGSAIDPALTSLQPGNVVSDGVHNAQDAAFASDLIVYHRQAVEIAGLAKGRTSTATVLALADEITSEQTPEIAELTRWLTEYGKPVPGSASRQATVVEGPVSLASAADLAALRSAKGAAFDRRFLTLMIASHEASVSQAQDEQRTGADERARGLAEDITTSQSARITQMRALLG